MKKAILATLAFIIPALTLFAQKNTGSKPFILGVTEVLTSKILNEDRTLNIYLPEGYKENDTTRYSVIYLLDGGADEDFIHVTGLVQFSSFPWVNRLAPSIVVGIANTDRERDMSYPSTIPSDKNILKTYGGSANFISFIETELQPYVQVKFRVSDSKTLIGESLAGLFATEVLFKKPTLFNKYIIVSPSLWWDDGSLLKMEPALLKENFTQATEIYIGVGKEGLTPGDKPRVMEVDANLLAEKIQAAKNKNLRIYFDYLPQENHATVAHQSILNAFKFFANKVSAIQ